MQRDWTKITLDEMLSLGIWRRVNQPATVYHLTDRANLDSIIADGMIKTGHDYICWFFESIENMWVSWMQPGRYSMDGTITTMTGKCIMPSH